MTIHIAAVPQVNAPYLFLSGLWCPALILLRHGFFTCSRSSEHPYIYIGHDTTRQRPNLLFGILGSRCLTGSALLDCHVLKGFGIYMIGILDNLSDVVEALFGHSSCNLDM